MSLVRFIALVGIVGLAIILGAILTSQDVEGWIEGLVIGAGAMILTAIVLLSRRLDRRP
jgi:chromate transport protein ChrA